MARPNDELPQAEVPVRRALRVDHQADALVAARVGHDEGRVRRPEREVAAGVAQVPVYGKLRPGAVRRVAPPALPVGRDLGVAGEAAPKVHRGTNELVSGEPVVGRPVGNERAPVPLVGEGGAPCRQVDGEDGAPHAAGAALDAARAPVGAPEHDAQKAGEHLPIGAAPPHRDRLRSRGGAAPHAAGIAVQRWEHALHGVGGGLVDRPGLPAPRRPVLGERVDALADVGAGAGAGDGASPQRVTEHGGRRERPPKVRAPRVAGVGRQRVRAGAGELHHVPVGVRGHAKAGGGDVPPSKVAVVGTGPRVCQRVGASVRSPAPPLRAWRVGPVPYLHRARHTVHGDPILPRLVGQAGDGVERRRAGRVHHAVAGRVEVHARYPGDGAVGDAHLHRHAGRRQGAIHDVAHRPLPDHMRPIEEAGGGLVVPRPRPLRLNVEERSAGGGQRGARSRRLRLRPPGDVDRRLDGRPGLIPGPAILRPGRIAHRRQG